MSRKDDIKYRISVIKTKKIIAQLKALEFQCFEAETSPIVKEIQAKIEKMIKIDSKPNDTLSLQNDHPLEWFSKLLRKLIAGNDWLIKIPDADIFTWTKVEILDFGEAVNELWEICLIKDIYIFDIQSRNLIVLFEEENDYEFHFSKL